MLPSLSAISSMATRQVLAELVQAYAQAHGVEVRLESVGGVEAARRVQGGECFDLVILANDAIDTLAASGLVLGASRCAIVDSDVAIAVRAGCPVPDISSADALRRSVMSARSIGYSTGPSGNALLALFERWGLGEALRARLVQARPGIPVGSLLVSGEVELGFQQHSELLNLDGLTLLGGMPPGLEIVTTFAGTIGACAAHPEAAQACLAFMAAAHTAGLKKRHGMRAPVHSSLHK